MNPDTSLTFGKSLQIEISGYAAAPDIWGVDYMTDDPRVWRVVETAARRLGVSALIHLHRIRIWPIEA